MPDASSGAWAKEPLLSVEYLASLHDLNHQFLDLADAWANDWAGSGIKGLSAAFAAQMIPLSAAQRRAAAACPYALFDLRFQDEAHWRLGFEQVHHRQVAEEAALDRELVGFVRMALFYAWHVAGSAVLAPQLLLGMSAGTAAAFRRVTLKRLSTLAAAEAVHLSVRWGDCSAYWNSLTGAALRPDAAALRRVQLYGLQLAAAARLP